MATSLVLHNNTYVESARMKKIKKQVEQLISDTILDEKVDIFDTFANELHTLEQLIISCQPTRSAHARQSL